MNGHTIEMLLLIDGEVWDKEVIFENDEEITTKGLDPSVREMIERYLKTNREPLK